MPRTDKASRVVAAPPELVGDVCDGAQGSFRDGVRVGSRDGGHGGRWH